MPIRSTPENLLKMQPSLTEGAALILPGEALDAIVYSCTSASVVIGDRNIEAAIHAAKPGVPVVTPTAAAVTGLKALGARRISVLTPYTIETSRPMADYFAELGFAIDRFTCLGLTDDREMARIAPDEILAFAARRWRRSRTRCLFPVRPCGQQRSRPGSRLKSASRWSPAISRPPGLACGFAAMIGRGPNSVN